ncbi:NADP-dependent oxidoreductase domain-containing protein [Lipomyces mesembrius]
MAIMGRAALTTVAGKAVGPVGYGMLGLTIPWALVEYPVAVKAMRRRWNRVPTSGTVLRPVKQRPPRRARLTRMQSLHYGTPQANSLHLIKHYFEQYPEDANKVVLSIKGAYHPKEGPNGSPAGIRPIKPIDIFECARVDPKVPIETSIKALADLVKEGKIRGVGLSEASANSPQGPCRTSHLGGRDRAEPVDARPSSQRWHSHRGIQPVGRGWLTGELRMVDDLAENDFRRMLPRFNPENFDQNLKLVEAVGQIAKRKGETTAQVAIGWVCHQDAIPIPGSTKEARTHRRRHGRDPENPRHPAYIRGALWRPA